VIVFYDKSTLVVAFCKIFAITDEASGTNSYQHFLLNQYLCEMSIQKLKLYPITPGQCRAARALLEITQPALADLAGLGLSTIVDFEKSRRDVSREAVLSLQRALQEAGIQFIAATGGGPGVRLRN